MKNSKSRQLHYHLASSPTPDSPQYQVFMGFQRGRIEENPRLKKLVKENHKKASSIRLTQSKNGIGFLQDCELRYFADEYNDRLWDYGFASMPASFNILEGFFKWNPELFFFELFQEEEHLFSFFDFIDFVTSDDCSDSLEYFSETIEDEVIYSYNILNEVKDLTFKTTDDDEYVIGGVSFIRRDNEVFMLVVAGEIANTDDISTNLPKYEEGRIGSRRSCISASNHREREAVKLLGKKDLWKVNIYVKIDLETKTIDSKYIQKDEGDKFSTITDDVDMFSRTGLSDEDLTMAITQNVAQIKSYDAIFEVAYKCLHLPEYFDLNEDYLVYEEHPTDLLGETITTPIFKNKIAYSSTHFFKNKDVWVIDKDLRKDTDEFITKQTELKTQTEGYWQRLDPGQAGKDKSGMTIHGRTWIERRLTWYETTRTSDTRIKVSRPSERSERRGWIYILRNASHKIGLFKIGLTTKTVEERAKQLSGTGAPDTFLIVHRWEVSDCVLAEKLIHETLSEYRLKVEREFFDVPLEKAINAISLIIQEVNKLEVKPDSAD